MPNNKKELNPLSRLVYSYLNHIKLHLLCLSRWWVHVTAGSRVERTAIWVVGEKPALFGSFGGFRGCLLAGLLLLAPLVSREFLR